MQLRKSLDKVSRFDVKHSDQELLAIVRAVTESVDPVSPEKITQASYDAARARAEVADTPRAYRIAKRLKCSWKEVLRLAHTAKNSDQIMGARSPDRVRKVLTKAEITHYLQRIAKDLDTAVIGVRDYDSRREELIQADNRRYTHRAGLEELMPSSQTIIKTAGTWEQALTWAGLKAREPARDPAYPAEQALDDFIADHGFAPTRKMLLEYQKRRGVATTVFPKPFRDWREQQLTGGIANRHGKVKEITHPAQAPENWDETDLTPVPPGYLRLQPTKFTLEMCERDLRKALDLAGARRLTQDLYQRLAKTHGLAAMATIQYVGRAQGLTWGEIRDKVIATRAQRPRHQSRVQP